MILGIIIGLFIVVCVGIVVMAIIRMAKDEKERKQKQQEAAKKVADYYSEELLQACELRLISMEEYDKMTGAKTIEFKPYRPPKEETEHDDQAAE